MTLDRPDPGRALYERRRQEMPAHYLEDGRMLPPLPVDFEPIYYETLEKVKGIAARVRREEEASRSAAQFPGLDANDQHAGSRNRITAYTTVPGNRAGLVIGNRGENLKRIERMAQVKLQFDQHWLGDAGEKRVQIIGLPEDVEEAIRLVKEKAEEPEGGRFPTTTVMVPSHRVGLVIGKGGETIRELQERSGAKITIAPDGGQDQVTGERPVNIMGDPEAVRKATDMINELVVHGTRPSQMMMGGAGGYGAAGRTAVTVHIPEHCVGAIIGKKAETIRSFQAMSNAKIFVEPSLQPGASKRVVHISGPSQECIAYAQQLVEEKVRQVDAAASGPLYGGTGYEQAQAGVIYQAPGDFAASIADPNAGTYDYAQYYQQYYQYYGAYPQAGAVDPSQQHQAAQQSFDYAAYAAQYAAQMQQQPPPQ